MNPALEAALRSWSFEPLPLVTLALTALVYKRGWRQLHSQIPHRFPHWRLVAFLAGIERELRTALLLIGAGSVAAAHQAPRLLTGELRDWQALLASMPGG